jgi:hypothetical protein
MNRAEHLAWAKSRALQYVELGQLEDAMGSIISDLKSHPETQNHIGIEMMMMMSGHLKNPSDMRSFIEGFN